MPELSLPSSELGLEQLTSPEAIELWVSVLPFMHYPRTNADHQRQRQELRLTLSGHFQTYLGNRKKRVVAKGRRLKGAVVAIEGRESTAFMDLGGLAGLADAPNTDHQLKRGKKITKNWFSVFYIAWTLARLSKIYPERGKAVSVNKAVHVALERKDRHPLIHGNRDNLRKAWSEFKPVAHLCAAYVLTQTALDEPTPKDPAMKLLENLDVFFGFAVYFQDFLTGLKPSHSQLSNLIALEDIWSVPESLGTEPLEPPLDPLTEAEAEAYKDYKSPTPYN